MVWKISWETQVLETATTIRHLDAIPVGGLSSYDVVFCKDTDLASRVMLRYSSAAMRLRAARMMERNAPFWVIPTGSTAPRVFIVVRQPYRVWETLTEGRVVVLDSAVPIGVIPAVTGLWVDYCAGVLV